MLLSSVFLKHKTLLFFQAIIGSFSKCNQAISNTDGIWMLANVLILLSCCHPKSIVLTIDTCHLGSPIKNTAKFKFCVWGIKFSTFLCYPGRNGWSNEKSNRLRNLKDSYLISSNIGLILLIIKRNVS